MATAWWISGPGFHRSHVHDLSNGGAITRLGDDGRVYYALDEPQAINALRKLGEWENVLGISYGDWQMREFITGRTAIGIMPMWQIDATQYEFKHGILPLPMGDDVDDYVFSPGVADAIFLPRNAAYPLGLIALDNFLFPLEDYYETMEDYIRARAFDRTSYEVLNRGVSEGGRRRCLLPQLPRRLVGG